MVQNCQYFGNPLRLLKVLNPFAIQNESISFQQQTGFSTPSQF